MLNSFKTEISQNILKTKIRNFLYFFKTNFVKKYFLNIENIAFYLLNMFLKKTTVFL